VKWKVLERVIKKNIKKNKKGKKRKATEIKISSL